MYQRQLVKTEMADSMGFTGEERADKQFTAAELRDLFTYNLTSATGCDTHAMVTRNAKTATLWTDVTNDPPDASLAQVRCISITQSAVQCNGIRADDSGGVPPAGGGERPWDDHVHRASGHDCGSL
jgi:hypothetical protein